MRALLSAAAVVTLIAAAAGPAYSRDRDRPVGEMPSSSIRVGFGDGFDHGSRHDRRRFRGTDTVIYYDRE